MEVHLKRIPWEPITIAPLGDVQFGSDGCDLPKLKEWIARCMERGSWFVGMGDMHDFLSPSNRKRLANAGLYDTAYDLLEAWHMEHLEQLKEILAPTKGRWLGMVEGHHFFEFSDGSTTDTELCRFLESPFLGTSGMVRVTFVHDNPNSHANIASCDMWLHHGTGGGSLAGSTLNRLQKAAGSFDADIYFCGHDTRLAATKVPYLQLRGDKRGKLELWAKTKTLVATGSFMEGYCVGSKAGRTGRPRGGYVEQRMLMPTSLGAAFVTVRPVRTENKVRLEVEATV